MKKHVQSALILLLTSISSTLMPMEISKDNSIRGKLSEEQIEIKFQEYKKQIDNFFKQNYEIACKDSYDLLKSLEIKNDTLFQRIGKKLDDHINNCKESYTTNIEGNKETERVKYKSNINQLIETFESEIKKRFSNTDYRVAYKNAREYIKINLVKNDFLKEYEDHLMNVLEECKKEALDEEKKRVENELENIFKANILKDYTFEQIEKKALEYWHNELNKNSEFIIFNNYFINLIGKYKDKTLIEILKQEALNSELKRVENQLKIFFEYEFSDKSEEKTLNHIQEELDKNNYLAKFKDHFLSLIENYKREALALKVKQIENALESVFKENDYEEACKLTSAFLESILNQKIEFKQFEEHLINFAEKCKNEALALEIKRKEALELETKLQNTLENIFKDNEYEQACKLASDTLATKLLQNSHSCQIGKSLVNFKNQLKEKTYLTKCLKALLQDYTKENESKIIKLINDGANPNLYVDKEGTTALMYAISKNNKTLVELLLNNGANPNLQDKKGNIALIQAIKNQNLQLAILLLNKGADINAKNSKGDTALTDLIKNNFGLSLIRKLTSTLGIYDSNAYYRYNGPYLDKIFTIMFLLAYELDINIKNNDNRSALDIYIEKDDPYLRQIFDKKVIQDRAKFLKKLKEMHEPNNNICDIEVLNEIEKFIDKNKKEYPSNALLIKEFFELFVKHYLKRVFAPEESSLTRLELNSQLQEILEKELLDEVTCRKIAKLIIAGANVNLKVNNENIILRILKSFNFETESNYQVALIKLLRIYKVDVNVVDNNNNNALMICISNNISTKDEATRIQEILNYINDPSSNRNNNKKCDVIAELIKAGININHKNNHGNTPLMHAINHIIIDSLNYDIIDLLITKGADLNAINNEDRNALKIIANMALDDSLKRYQRRLRFKVLSRLLSNTYLIDINHKFEDGSTLLIWAVKNNLGAHDDRTELLDEICARGGYTSQEREQKEEQIKTSLDDHTPIGIVRGLLNFVNLDLNIKDENHKTALMYAVENQDYKLVEILLGLEKDTNSIPKIDYTVENENGETALLKAIKNNDKQMIELFLKGMYNKKAFVKNLSIIKYVINTPFKDGYTLLMKVVMLNKAEIVKLLLSQPNIDIEAKTPRGETARSLAPSSDIRKSIEAALKAQNENKKWYNLF
ncbi:ankyrin repeat domain-containing protein [Candidatus Babela massiliensis]|uniref:Ankyrin repeats containing protein n=1 Tax=Candidatus Babela massiliensis TaxID=673862 RepID=V6DHN0_9BACT|nr:ankyrin repeat domain-containing protein [Candidatus Babela massiliensis]CDK31055.1 Ankyrin repeats containing protein [Candidatus Babela massiliensis]